MKTDSDQLFGRTQTRVLPSPVTPRPGGRTSVARPFNQFRVYVLSAVIFPTLIAISAAQNPGRQSTVDGGVAYTTSYGSLKHSELYTERRSRNSEVYRGPSGEVLHTRLPQGAKRITVNGRSYYRKKDTFYYRHFFEGSYVYTEGPPPIGLTVAKLPGSYSIQTHHGTRYHVSGDVYYVKETRGYRVVPPPKR